MTRRTITKIAAFGLLTFVTVINASALPPITFAISVEKNPDGKVSIKGTTNLPDDTGLMVNLKNQLNNYSAQDTPNVTDHAFKTEFFSDHGSALPSGTYRVEITVPIANVQPASVRALFGEHGENLSGPYVKKSETFRDDNIVEYSQEVTIGETGSTNTAPLTAVPKRQQREEETQTQIQFSSGSTGYDWKRASTSYKIEYCSLLATTLQSRTPKATGQYLYEALDSFYASEDPNILKQKIVEIAPLCAAMADSAHSDFGEMMDQIQKDQK